MKTDQEILNQFGRYVGRDAFDSSYASLIEALNGTSRNPERKEIVEVFNDLSPEKKLVIRKFMFEVLSGALFDFLRIFEEHREFKIIYEEQGVQVNLNEISEMLKAEPIIENGWIARYSNQLNSENQV